MRSRESRGRGEDLGVCVHEQLCGKGLEPGGRNTSSSIWWHQAVGDLGQEVGIIDRGS